MTLKQSQSARNDYRELLIGCGSRREKDLRLPTAVELRMVATGHVNAANFSLDRPRTGTEFRNLTTLDNNRDHKPDIIHDLTDLPLFYRQRLPWPDWPMYTYPGGVRTEEEYQEACRKCQQERAQVDEWNSGSVMESNYYDEIHAYEVLEHIGGQGNYQLFFAQFSEFWRVLKPDGFLFATCPSWRSLWAWGDPSHSRIINSGTLVFLSQSQYQEQVGITPMSDYRHIYKANFEPVFVHEDDDTFLFVLMAVK